MPLWPPPPPPCSKIPGSVTVFTLPLHKKNYVSRAGDEGPSGEMYFLQEFPAGNGRVNTSDKNVF